MPDAPVSIDVRERAAGIVAGLPVAERIRLVSGRGYWTTEEVVGRAPSVMLCDGPHGLRKQLGTSDHVGRSASVPATCFPTAATLACSWDVELLSEVGAALGREARAEDVGMLLGPGLNLKRHPRGGRNFEYFSEDPHLSGTLAAAMVRGIQSQGVAACVKHFAANNQETNRMVIDTIIDERTLRELYLRGFEIAVEQGDPAAIMTAYNKVNGQYCSESTHLVGDVLRGEWGSDALVVSDWMGANDRVAGLEVGLDLEMPGGAAAFDAEIAEALTSGRLREQDLDRAAIRVVALALRWEQARSQPTPVSDPDAHHALARRVAAAGTVLLTNDGVLPLAGEGSIAVIGSFAQTPRYQGEGSSRVNPTRVDTLVDALAGPTAGQGEVRYAAGYDVKTGETTPALLAAAAREAQAADHAVLVVGLPERFESEGLDREHCRLPEGMEFLVDVVLAANPRTVVVLMNGAVVELPWAQRPAALVEANLGGQAGGSALADVLLGLAEPAGRLAVSIPHAVADLPSDRNFPGQPRQVEYREGFHVGYRFHDTAGVPAHFPFGHGLGYTRFEHSGVAVTGTGTDLTVGVDVTNVGRRPGAEVVQVYVRDVQSTIARPDKELAGYAKVDLDPGASTHVQVHLDRRSFTVWDVHAHDWLVEAGEFEILVGASSTDIRGRATVTIDSPDRVGPVPQVAGTVATDAEFTALLGRPIPVPTGSRPFTRTSTPAELTTSRVGRGLVALLNRTAGRAVTLEDADDLGEAEQMMRAVMSAMPLRAFVQMSNGRLSLAALDRLIAGLNSDMRTAVRRR